MDVVLLVASFAVILAGALLFTNAVEWAGHRMSMGQGAVGSLLAAVGTAMPETLIPVVAIVGGAEGSEDVAIGAIIGAPFLLATLAMMLVGLAALGYKDRREQGVNIDAHRETVERDLIFFLVFFTVGIGLGLGAPDGLRIPLAILFVIAYGVYVARTLMGGGDVQQVENIGPLTMARPLPPDETSPPVWLIVVQLVVGLGAIVGGAHLFVEELVAVAESLGIEPLVLSLVLAPLATELPEKANSFFWVRDGKDSLALGNIAGAMVFQSAIPIAFGLVFTEWDLESFALISGGLGLVGGGLAYLVLHRARRFSLPAIVTWGVLYAVFPIYVVVAG